jgi:DNA-directed RNA polymerase specialized sigma24 family protein
MNAIRQTDRQKLLATFKGMTNAELLEQPVVRRLFHWEAATYTADSTEDLRQRAFILFLETKPFNSRDRCNFSAYLAKAIKNIVSKAHAYRHRKKRHLPTVNFPRNREGKVIEPQGQRAAILFDHDELTQIHSTIWQHVKDYERRKIVMGVLDGLLDGESSADIARRMEISADRVYLAKKRLMDAMEN